MFFLVSTKWPNLKELSEMLDCSKSTDYKFPSQKTKWIRHATLIQFILIYIDGRANDPQTTHTERILCKK